MTIFLNNNPISLPEENMNVNDLVKWKQIPDLGTAVAINDVLIKREKWSVTQLKDMDRVTVISASYGG